MITSAPPEIELPDYDAQLLATLSAAAGETAAVRAQRTAAFEIYRNLPLPLARDEEWRHSPITLFPFTGVQLAPQKQNVTAFSTDPWDADFDVVIDVQDNGYAVCDQAGLLKRGALEILPLAEAGAQRSPPSAIQEMPRRKFAALNQAFWTIGFDVRLLSGSCRLLLRWQFTRAGRLELPRVAVAVEAGAQLNLVERWRSTADGPIVVVGAHDFRVAPDARLERVALHEWGPATFCMAEDAAVVGERGRADWITAVLGGQVVKLVAGCDVAGRGADAHLSGLYFADGSQHVDQRTVQLHSSPDTTSHLLYKGAVQDRSHAIYQGLINARRGAVRVDAYQMNRNLVLNQGARVDSLPGLEIDADDLKCSHGSATGSLDPEQLFYLRARGIAADEARRLLVAAFFEEVIGKTSQARVQEHLRDAVREKMERSR